jgi:glycosyltransferase involved in cell wall biosynthesis
VDLEKFTFSPEISKPFMGLYSGTYSNYYDMETSELFLRELSKLVPIETHWAKPHESARDKLDAGEGKIFTLRQAEMPSIIAKYSFGISICRSDSRSTLAAAVPTKIGEFLATGRPVIVNSGLGDMDQYLTEFNAGIILDHSNLNFKNSAIQLIDLLTDPETPYRCRALAEKYFSIRDGAERYRSLYSKMLG